MVALFTIVGLALLAAGGVGLFLATTSYPPASLQWIEGILTYGVFTILGLATIILVTMVPRE